MTVAEGRLSGNRSFRLLWIGETTSALGSNVAAVALPLVALGVLHAGVVPVSLLTAAAWLPWLIVGLPAGAWLDRMTRRRVLLVCDAASFLLFLSVPVAAWCGVLTIAQLVAVALLAGTAKVFFSTAYRLFIPAVVGADRVLDANSRLTAADSATQVVGPGLGGVIAQAVGAVSGVLVDALSFVVSFACLRRISAEEPRPAAGPRRALRADIAEGARFVLRDRLLRTMVGFGCTANFALTAYSSISLVFLVRTVGLAPAVAGLLFAAGSACGALGALAAPVLGRRWGTARALLICKVGSPPLALLVPFTTSGAGVVLFLAGTTAMVTGIVTGNVVSAGFMTNYCPEGIRSRVMSTASVVNFGAMPLGAVAGGLLAERVGFRAALALIFLGLIASTLILVRSPLRRMRDLPTSADVPSTDADAPSTDAGAPSTDAGALPTDRERLTIAS